MVSGCLHLNFRIPPNLFSILKRAALQIFTRRRKHSFSTVSVARRNSEGPLPRLCFAFRRDRVNVAAHLVSELASAREPPGEGWKALVEAIYPNAPMRHWGVSNGKNVGVVGLGGLGHMGVKFAHAFGAHVVVFTTSPGKKEAALGLGADEVVVSRNADEMKKHTGSFDFILDTVSADHDINAYLNLLRRDGNITLVDAPAKPLGVSAFGLIMGRRSLAGSAIGGTQEMLDFCGAHNITADVEVIPIRRVNEAYERLLKSDVRYRFAIDMASLKSE